MCVCYCVCVWLYIRQKGVLEKKIEKRKERKSEERKRKKTKENERKKEKKNTEKTTIAPCLSSSFFKTLIVPHMPRTPMYEASR